MPPSIPIYTQAGLFTLGLSLSTGCFELPSTADVEGIRQAALKEGRALGYQEGHAAGLVDGHDQALSACQEVEIGTCGAGPKPRL